MTNRERFIYMRNVCLLWALIYWREIALALVGVVIVIVLATGCTIGPIANSPTPPPTITRTATPPPTLPTLSPTAEATVDPTPTQEFGCVPDSWAALDEATYLYQDQHFTETYGLYERGVELSGWSPILLETGRVVLLLERDVIEPAWLVRVWDAPELSGWIPGHALPDACE